MKTKKYWQAVDADGENATFCEEKPCLINGNTYVNKQKHYIRGFLFPIPLKPMQIAEITVCENGTWSYEIEREEGWYMARGIENNSTYFLRYSDGEFYNLDGVVVITKCVNISPTRIPDECII